MHKKRLLVVLAVPFMLAAVVAARLWTLQVADGAAFEEIARNNRVRIQVLRPVRGTISDRRGRVMAEDRPRWTVSLNPGKVLDPARAAAEIAAQTGTTQEAAARSIGRGFGRRMADEVRTLREKAVDETLEEVSGILGVGREKLVAGLRAAELQILEVESRERVRVVGLEAPAGQRREALRDMLRRFERRAEAEMVAAAAPGYVLVAGIRYDLLDAAEAARRDWVANAAAEAGLDAGKVLKKLAEAEKASRLRAVKAAWSRDHVLCERFFSHESILKLEASLENLPGISIGSAPARMYPRGVCACHAVGYLGFLGWTRRGGEEVNRYEEKEEGGFFYDGVSEFLDREQYEEMEAGGEFVRDLFGKSGAECMIDTELRGSRGARLVEHDRMGRMQKNLKVHPPRNGGNVTLTIDAELSEAAAKAFRRDLCPNLPEDFAPRGSAVVLDPRTGAVLVLVSVPGFDPNDLIPPVDPGKAGVLFTDPAKPLLNRAISGCYEPGSTFKAVTALAAFAEGMLKDGETIGCGGTFRKYGHSFRCNARYGHGDHVTLDHALMKSCNVFFYELGSRLGSLLGAHAEAYGFGRPAGVGLPGERGGCIPQDMMPGFYVQCAIGQRITATPLQLARFAAFIANGGVLVEPFLLAGREAGPAPVTAPPGMDEVRKGFRLAVEDREGTAALPLLRKAKAAGKTGTAETGRKAGGVSLNHAWFIGYAPHDSPEFAIAVVVEDVPHGVHGGDVAAPVAAEILAACMASGGSR